MELPERVAIDTLDACLKTERMARRTRLELADALGWDRKRVMDLEPGDRIVFFKSLDPGPAIFLDGPTAASSDEPTDAWATFEKRTATGDDFWIKVHTDRGIFEFTCNECVTIRHEVPVTF